MRLDTLCSRLDETLRIDDFTPIDVSPIGLQVGPKELSVSRVAFAVDAAVATIEAAIDADADLLVTHHGLWLSGPDQLTGSAYERVEPLIGNDLALYVAHLPLDAHQSLGNAAGIADLLNLGDREPFGAYEGEHLGQRGTLPASVPLEDIGQELKEGLTGVRDVYTLSFGPPSVRDVAIVTGAGINWLDEAIAADVDLFITGEGKQHIYHEAREAGMNMILAGHYATETAGIRSLAAEMEAWGLTTTTIDHPTGL